MRLQIRTRYCSCATYEATVEIPMEYQRAIGFRKRRVTCTAGEREAAQALITKHLPGFDLNLGAPFRGVLRNGRFGESTSAYSIYDAWGKEPRLNSSNDEVKS